MKMACIRPEVPVAVIRGIDMRMMRMSLRGHVAPEVESVLVTNMQWTSPGHVVPRATGVDARAMDHTKFPIPDYEIILYQSAY